MHRIQYWARQKAHGTPLVASTRRTNTGVARTTSRVPSSQPTHGPGGVVSNQIPSGDAAVAGSVIPPTENEKNGDAAAVNGGATKPNVAMRFVLTVTDILFSSYVNILLVFVPVGIAAHFAKLSAGIVFAMNAIAIIPLAGLLSHATESVASRMGDTIGALMNVTFGNAVELIIFIIALVKDEIEIVQASLVGSILANLLLILGMCFLLGGLRYREQIYNSTVTQMSACLLSLSVSSLLLPTAFHASFSSATNADTKVLAVSRGTSVVLLLVYVLYLVFQLNSHAYMYESTPRHIVERESLPGPAASYFNSSSSSSSETSSDSSHGDSDSDASRSTAKRIKRVIKKGRKKMHNRSASTDANSAPTSALPHNDEVASASASGSTTAGGPSDAAEVPPIDNGVVADDEDDEAAEEKPRDKKKRKHHKKKKVAETKSDAARAAEGDNDVNAVLASSGMAAMPESGVGAGGSVRRVDFALGPDVEAQTAPRPQPFSLRWLARPAGLTKTLPDNVFHARAGETQASSSRSNAQPLSTPDAFAASNQPRPQPQLRRTASMPVETRSYRNQPGALPPIVPVMVNRRSFMAPAAGDGDEDDEEEEPQISRTTAVLLLLVSTGLVALCAEFMVGSINEVVSGNSGISEAFIGLILLPIVGNAAEHVTGVTVAMKNKMDLALGVALGSSIQIAIFVTPVVVLLGWIMGKDMSLYFTLFETVSMFVSAFIVNFLVLDGRSNYLEGALLCAAYVIIAVASFFYPGKGDANSLGGGTDNVTESVTVEAAKMAVRGLVSLM